MKAMDTKERFMRHVNVSTLNSCWLWTGQTNKDGYGLFSPGSKRAHKMSWLLFKGPIDKGLLVLHKCDTRNCVNPDHLFLGTHQDNADDMLSKNRGNKVRGSKVFGAKLTEEKVLEIKRANDDWITLANKYGVSVWAINNIKCGRTWKWLTDNKISAGGAQNSSALGVLPPIS
jgi:hypothetical protein